MHFIFNKNIYINVSIQYGGNENVRLKLYISQLYSNPYKNKPY